MIIEQQILKALMPLTDNRVYPTILPEKTDYPAITYHRLDAKPQRESVDFIEIDNVKSLFQVVIWGKTYSDCVELTRKTVALLGALNCRLEGAADGYDKQVGVRSAILDFCYWGDLALVPKQPDNPQPKTPINSLLAAIQTELSDIATAQLASHQCAIFDLPLIRLKLDQVKPASDLDDWDGRQVMQCYFTAYAYHMVGYAEDLAIRLVSAIKFNQWGMGESVSTPISIEANQNSVAWGYKPYEVWRISWQQSLALSQSIWNDDGEPPKTVLASHEPKTGKAHEPEYEPI